MIRKLPPVLIRWIMLFALFALVAVPLRSEPLSLQQLVTPSAMILKDGHPVTFAIHGFIEFQSLAEVFPYIQAQRQRWKGKISAEEEQRLVSQLLREAIESRVVSMEDERPLEALLTHTSGELREAVARLQEPVPPGYVDDFLALQEKWKHSLNCWSATPSIPGRVLSNWYPIEEGLRLYGATYDSAEHFWQSVKYHSDVTVGDVEPLIVQFENADWSAWLKRLEDDPKTYLPNAYAVEFLRHNLTVERMRWFREELARQGVKPSEHARLAQQRGEAPFRFSAYEEKVLWGDLADVFQLVYLFSLPDDPMRTKLAQQHFDGVYLHGRKMGFISEEFRSEMLEIWKVKYLQMERFREVISLIPMEIRLEHFLNDGDSPDIPIPAYVAYLNQIREMARAKSGD